jgi:two-component system, LuxR family, response regulator FixJ
MAKPETTVYIVDDDQAMRKSLHWLIESVGLNVETFPSARRFLESYRPGRPGCLVLDMRMPGISGLDLQEKLAEQQINLPVIIITGHGDVPMAVRAMKAGAIDFIEKPFNDQVLLDRIQSALEQDAELRSSQALRAEVAARLALLTPREREVMDMVVEGKPNKVIAAQLGVSAKTVEAHRAKVMEKMQARALADLIRMILSYKSAD